MSRVRVPSLTPRVVRRRSSHVVQESAPAYCCRSPPANQRESPPPVAEKPSGCALIDPDTANAPLAPERRTGTPRSLCGIWMVFCLGIAGAPSSAPPGYIGAWCWWLRYSGCGRGLTPSGASCCGQCSGLWWRSSESAPWQRSAPMTPWPHPGLSEQHVAGVRRGHLLLRVDQGYFNDAPGAGVSDQKGSGGRIDGEA